MKTFKMTERQYEKRTETGVGYCVECGAKAGGCEPDARNYICGTCSQSKVFGMEKLLIMGLVQFK